MQGKASVGNFNLIVSSIGLAMLLLWGYFFVQAFQLKKTLPWGFLIVIVGMLFSGHGFDISNHSIVLHIDLLFVVMIIGVFWDINNIRRLVSKTKFILIRSCIGCVLGLIFGVAMIVFDGGQNIQINNQYSLMALFALSIQISLAEELLFRGFFLDYLRGFQFKEIPANLIQSTLFAILHIPRYLDNWAAVFVIFLSGYLAGLFTIRDKSLATAFFVHITINIIAIVWWLIKMQPDK